MPARLSDWPTHKPRTTSGRSRTPISRHWAAMRKSSARPGLGSDVLMRIVRGPRAVESRLRNSSIPDLKAIGAAYTAGLNYFLEKHPQVKPRLIKHFEPWHVVAFDRFTMLSFMYSKSHAKKPVPAEYEERIAKTIGSNEWAIGPSKTKSKKAMLFINPHQPWYGYGQFYEAHVESGEGLHFSGIVLLRIARADDGPQRVPGLGPHRQRARHCRRLSRNVRRSAASAQLPLRRRVPDGGRMEGHDPRQQAAAESRVEHHYTFRKTHHGPIVGKEDATHALTVKIARIFDAVADSPGAGDDKAKNFAEWKAGISMLNLPMFNTAYADADGTIFYVYNGCDSHPRSADMTGPVRSTAAIRGLSGRGCTRSTICRSFSIRPTVTSRTATRRPFMTADDGNPGGQRLPAIHGRRQIPRSAQVADLPQAAYAKRTTSLLRLAAARLRHDSLLADGRASSLHAAIRRL